MLPKVSKYSAFSAIDFLPITQRAAIGASLLRGRCDKNAGDALAVEAMRKSFDKLPYKGIVVVGEGEKDEAPMLYIGEEVGQGDEVLYEIVVDPLEGTRLLAEGRPNAISVLGIVPYGTISFPKESYYMQKLVLSTEVAKHIDMDAPLCDIIYKTTQVLGKRTEDIEIFILDKPRHHGLIQEILQTGARVHLHTDGDVAGSLLTIAPQPCIDIMVGIGGTPEGVLTAVAIKASGRGQLFARYSPQSAEEKDALIKKGIDFDRWFTADDIIPTNDVFFLATGVTDGILLDGIHDNGTHYSTHSLVIDGRENRSFFVSELLAKE